MQAVETEWLVNTSSSRRSHPAPSRTLGAALARGTLGSIAPSEGPGLKFVDFDSSYLARLQSRDAQTEAHFVGYFSELIRLKLLSRLRSREATEDVRQETFVRVLTLIRSDGLKHPERLGPLVNSVCNNVLMEHYRTGAKRLSPIDREDEATFIDPQPSAFDAQHERETERVVQQILKDLPERDRRLLKAVLLDDREKDEICVEFGITRNYLRVLVHRAKMSFKTYYLSRLGGTKRQ
jgi:RNA polymerase sigma-70 factor (ECF subfamily)